VVAPSDEKEWDALLTAEQYATLVAESAH